MLGPHRFYHRVESGHVGRNLCFDIPQNRSLCSRLSFQKELEKDEEMCVESIEKLTVHFREVYLFLYYYYHQEIFHWKGITNEPVLSL
jgi:hypothetical protein